MRIHKHRTLFYVKCANKGVLHYGYQRLENGTLIQFEQNRSEQEITKLNIAKTESTLQKLEINMAPSKLEQET